MSHLYTVFTHARQGQWGFAAPAPQGQVRTVAIDPTGRASLGAIEPIWLAPLVQQRLRAGYKKGGSRYLSLNETAGVLMGEFVSQHPELAAGEGAELLFFIAVPPGADMGQAAEEWRQRLEEMPGGGRGREAWLRLCSQATAYVPVRSDDVRVVLLAAQWAGDNKLVLVSGAGELPLNGPREQRHEWRDWLAGRFQPRDLDQALIDFGWSPDQATAAVDPVHPSTAPTEPGEWLALALQASF